MAIKFYRAKELPSPLTAAHDGVWFIKPDGAAYSRTYNVKNGVATGDGVDGLEIGGRNYLINSASQIDTSRHVVVTIYQVVSQLLNQEVIFSFDMMTQGTLRDITVYPYQNNGITIKDTASFQNSALGKWERFHLTTKIVQLGSNPAYTPGAISFYDWVGSNNYSIRNLKLEIGNKATDWTPAPEDKEDAFAKNTAFNKNFGTAAGTVAAGNDGRFTDAREWSAATIDQAEAESGAATTRRAWTAQRVRQAIDAWWNGVSSSFALKSWVGANFDKYTKWNLKTNGIQRKGITSEDEVDFVAGDNIAISYGANGKVIIESDLSQVPIPTLDQVTGEGNNSSLPLSVRYGTGPLGEQAILRDYCLELKKNNDSVSCIYHKGYIDYYIYELGTRTISFPYFPTDDGSQAYIPITVNGTRADTQGNIQIDSTQDIYNYVEISSNYCVSGLVNNTRFNVKTNSICISIDGSGADEGKEFIVINDSGNAVGVSVSSSKFYKPHNGFLPRPIINSFPTGYVGRFRVIGGEMVEIG